ncbi:hypothetical protein BDP67DRAFT_274080 [Colletotrichum lupini]|nr:hypothetical protein BDP67DRAFT_274080 [Colletotrichum lupini]
MASHSIEIQTRADFLADLPIYEDEKPYYLHASDSASDRLDQIKITNVEWDTRPVTVRSMRDNTNVGLDKTGFTYWKHESQYLPHRGMNEEKVEKYRTEGEELLRSVFDADFVRCYDFKMRKNAPMTLENFDPNDPLLVEQAAVGAHVGTLYLSKYSQPLAHGLRYHPGHCTSPS